MQYTKISLEPHYLNNEIYNNIFTVLKKKVEEKCNNNGYIIKVNKIISLSDGIMPVENLNGNVIFNVKYECKICIPIENDIIIGIINILESHLIVCKNGPITIFIPKDNIDSGIWNIPNFTNIKTDKKLERYDRVKILILTKRKNQNDNQIITIGRLLDIPTKQEINDFYELI